MVMYWIDYDDLPPSCRIFALTYHGLECLHNIQLRYHPRLNFLSEEELEVDINSRNLVPCIGALIQRTRSLLFQLRMRYHPRCGTIPGSISSQRKRSRWNSIPVDLRSLSCSGFSS